MPLSFQTMLFCQTMQKTVLMEILGQMGSMVAMVKMGWMVVNSIAIKTPTMVGPVVQTRVSKMVQLMEDLELLKSVLMSPIAGEELQVVKINQPVLMVMAAIQDWGG